ncbi:MAG: PEP-CTERM-box response regulator transcription factor [bacterium]
MSPQDKPRLLIVEDDQDLATQLKWALARHYEVDAAQDAASALRVFKKARPKLVTLDLGLPPDPGGVKEGFNVLGNLLESDPMVKVIVITGRQEREHGLRAVAMGAYDYMSKPVDVQELEVVLKRALHVRALEEENQALEAREHRASAGEMLWASKVMEEVWVKIQRVAKTDAPVLLLGETGTGKELAAKAIHGLSPRRNAAFVPIDCGAIPESLLESELFGHEKGAFTGAHTTRKGRVEAAQGGTLFLDEVGDLPASLQMKLLRLLQEQRFQRVGGRQWIEVDARVVAATNRDLGQAIKEGRFREDLYFRLGVVVIELPPLRHRSGDVTLLANAFLERFKGDSGKRLKGFTRDALEAMEAHQWPGNVRELENRVRRAVIMAKGSRITTTDLDLEAQGETLQDLDLRSAREALEREMVEKALARCGGNLTQAAQILGISRPTLYDLMDKLGIRKEAQTE